MERVFTCGCRWGDKNISYSDIFIKNKVAILGLGNRGDASFQRIIEGDLIALKYGHSILAVALAKSSCGKKTTWGKSKCDLTNKEAKKYGFSLNNEILVIPVDEWIEVKDISYKTSRGCNQVQQKKLIDELNSIHTKYLSQINTIHYSELLEQKKQIILQGAPGTGKTYATAEIAVNIIDSSFPFDRKELMKRYNELVREERIFFTTFHQSMDYEEFVEGYKPETGDNDNMIYEVRDGIFKKACKACGVVGTDKIGIDDAIEKFKEEFFLLPHNGDEGQKNLFTIQGIKLYIKLENNLIYVRPSTQLQENIHWYHCNIKHYYNNKRNGGVSSYARPIIDYLIENYNLLPPNYKETDVGSEQTTTVNKNPVILIIDEINRGNISKILGELITLLEKDKRRGEVNGISVTLPYSGEIFSVPQNLYIISTMNTADRSIGYLDYALRRRFAFISLKANKEAIENYYEQSKDALKDEAIKLFDSIMEFINKNISEEFDLDDLMIGHSYFMADTEDELEIKLEYEIKPLLIEYAKDGILKSLEKTKEFINNSFTIPLNITTTQDVATEEEKVDE